MAVEPGSQLPRLEALQPASGSLVRELKDVLRHHKLPDPAKLTAMSRVTWEELALGMVRPRHVYDETFWALFNILCAVEEICANDREKALGLLEKAIGELKRSMALPPQHLPVGPLPSSDDQ